MMIYSESVLESYSKVVDLFNMKLIRQESCKSHNHMIRYAISTEQMQDLNTLTYRNSTELNTMIHKTNKYSKAP